MGVCARALGNGVRRWCGAHGAANTFGSGGTARVDGTRGGVFFFTPEQKEKENLFFFLVCFFIPNSSNRFPQKKNKKNERNRCGWVGPVCCGREDAPRGHQHWPPALTRFSRSPSSAPASRRTRGVLLHQRTSSVSLGPIQQIKKKK